MSHLINQNRSGTFFGRGSGRAETVIIKNLINVSYQMSRNFVAPQQDKLQANLLSEHTLKNKFFLKKNSVTEAYVLTILKHSVKGLRFLFLLCLYTFHQIAKKTFSLYLKVKI